MTWHLRLDMELAWLLYKVHQVFGRAVVDAAVDRAILTIRLQGLLVPEPPPRVLENALREELRQVARLH